jgi:hypothetical protein
MSKSLEALEQSARKRNFDSPPLDQWHPPLSGDIDIEIAEDGTWFHEGGEIQRDALVQLFASILRREEDGQYYLVTPAEKWRIRVARHPLMVVGVDASGEGGEAVITATLNTQRQVALDAAHNLTLDPDGIPVLSLDHGLTALFNRNAWYQLVDLADEEATVVSCGQVFSLGSV